MAEDQEHGYHPGRSEYIQIGIILTVLTGIEVALYFAEPPRALTISFLLALTAMKFLLVAFWFMHLRFDHPLFRRLFAMGGALAILVYSVVVVLFAFGPV
jgi:cytochrome c oxidase subunit 4